jgi:small-conductance mechanosensitive channel
MEGLFGNWQNLLWSAGILLGAVLLGLVIHRIAFSVVRKIAERTSNRIDRSIVRHAYAPATLIFPLVAVLLALSALPLPKTLVEPFRHLVILAMIAGCAWLAIRLVNLLDEFVGDRYRLDVTDNLAARRIQTQIHVLKRIAVILIGIVAMAAMLMTFPSIWNIGAGLFASAGVAGLVAGMAARPALSNLLAGIQIAMTEPIRIDDVVIVEGEWGRIEEIGTTYVIVRIWDLRRLVVPLSYFIDHPFQNWTRTSADLLGTVYIYADYNVPVEEVRQELHRILQTSDLWDGKTWGLQVTDSNDRVLQLRALMSAADSGTAWDLRCLVRERLIGFLQERHPGSLPKFRADVLQTRPIQESAAQ